VGSANGGAKFAPHKQRRGLFFSGFENCLHGVAKLAEWFLRGKGGIIFLLPKTLREIAGEGGLPV
jgi:hypothetical protein